MACRAAAATARTVRRPTPRTRAGTRRRGCGRSTGRWSPVVRRDSAPDDRLVVARCIVPLETSGVTSNSHSEEVARPPDHAASRDGGRPRCQPPSTAASAGRGEAGRRGAGRADLQDGREAERRCRQGPTARRAVAQIAEREAEHHQAVGLPHARATSPSGSPRTARRAEQRRRQSRRRRERPRGEHDRGEHLDQRRANRNRRAAVSWSNARNGTCVSATGGVPM